MLIDRIYDWSQGKSIRSFGRGAVWADVFLSVYNPHIRGGVDEGLIVSLVCQERHVQPRLGVRKLRSVLSWEFCRAGVLMGRDRLFKLLRRHGLLILRRRRSVRTTDSRHGLGVYPNRLKDAILTGPHQAWGSDITYLRTHEGFMYLLLVMDAYSRKVIGYDCHDRLESEGALRSLSMAMGQLPASASVIHHSDRGSQYCSRRYVQRLKRRGIQISMTE